MQLELNPAAPTAEIPFGNGHITISADPAALEKTRAAVSIAPLRNERTTRKYLLLDQLEGVFYNADKYFCKEDAEEAADLKPWHPMHGKFAIIGALSNARNTADLFWHTTPTGAHAVRCIFRVNSLLDVPECSLNDARSVIDKAIHAYNEGQAIARPA